MNQITNFNDYNRDAFIARVAEATPAGSAVLDAGAGPCKYKALFRHCEYKAQDFGQYEGTDHKYGELDYVCDITSIPVPDNCFDLVFCTEVLEHLPRPDLALAEFSRILRPGGRLAITAPLGSAIHMPPYHYYGGFSRHWYEYFLPSNGLELESCEKNGGFFKQYGQESRRFLTLLTPSKPLARLLFLPFKALLAIHFRLFLPVVCHWLDRFDTTEAYTVGYFVKARKKV